MFRGGHNRINELFDALKGEVEQLTHETVLLKAQKEDVERKLSQQLTELATIQQTIFDLERSHQKSRQQYEDEIKRLRGGLNNSGFQNGNLMDMNNQAQQQQQQQQQLINQNNNSNPTPPALSLPARSLPSSLSSIQQPTPQQNGNNSVPPIGFPNNQQQQPQQQQQQQQGGSSGTPLPSLNAKLSSPFPTNNNQQPTPNNNQQQAPSTPQIGDDRKRPLSASGNSPTQPPSKKQNTDGGSSSESELNTISNNNTNNNGNNNNNSESQNQMQLDGGSGTTASTNPNNLNSLQKTIKGEGEDWVVGYNPSVTATHSVELMHTIPHNSVVCSVKFSSDGKWLATGSNKSAQIYDVQTGEKQQVCFADEAAGKSTDLYIRSVCFSPDNRFLAAGAEDKTVKLWNVKEKKIQQILTGHEVDIYCVDYSKDGQYIVSGSGDKKARIWDVERGECLFTLGNEEVGPKDGVTSVAFSPDGKFVVAGSLDRIVRVWDAKTGYFLERHEGHMDSVYSVAFSPDGKFLASGSLDKTLRLWDISANARSRSRCRSTFTGHKDYVLSVAFSPDGQFIISGSKDRTVQFWDPRSASSTMMLQGHKNSVISVAMSPTGGVFATGSGDFRSRIWRMVPL